MRNFHELCAARYSLREFADQPVERDKVVQCLEAARLAPSASNGQPWRFVVFDDPMKKQQLCDQVFTGIHSYSRGFARAPVIVALLVKTGSVISRIGNALQDTRFQLIDAGIAGEHFVLQAQELGLGTCWIGWYNPGALVKFLNLKGKGYTPVCLIALGYPPDRPSSTIKPKHRRELNEIAGWNELPQTRAKAEPVPGADSEF